MPASSIMRAAMAGGVEKSCGAVTICTPALRASWISEKGAAIALCFLAFLGSQVVERAEARCLWNGSFQTRHSISDEILSGDPPERRGRIRR